jgi:hypothetical protein
MNRAMFGGLVYFAMVGFLLHLYLVLIGGVSVYERQYTSIEAKKLQEYYARIDDKGRKN